MNKIYEHSDDLHVRATVLYVSPDVMGGAYGTAPTSEPEGRARPADVVYADAELTTPVNAKDLKNAFLKGCVVTIGGYDVDEEHRPYVKPAMLDYEGDVARLRFPYASGLYTVCSVEVMG